MIRRFFNRWFDGLNRHVLAVGLVMGIAVIGDLTLYAVLPIPAYQDALGLLPWHVGVLLSMNRWVRLVTNHLAQRLYCGRFPARWVLFACLMSPLLSVVYATTPAFVVFLLARMAWGFCWSLLRQASQMTVVETMPDDKLSRGMGYANGLTCLGCIFGVLVGGLLCDWIGFSAAFVVLAGLSLVGVWPAWVSQRFQHQVHTAPTRSGPAAVPWRQGAGLLGMGFGINAATSLVMATLGLAVAERVGSGLVFWGVLLGVATLNGVLQGGRWAVDSVLAPWLGALADRVGPRRVSIACFAGMAALLYAMPFVQALPLAGLLLVFSVLATTLALGLVAQAGRGGPVMIARYATAADMGSAAGPLCGWLLLQAVTDSRLTFHMGCGVCVLAFALALKAQWRRQPRPGARQPNEPCAAEASACTCGVCPVCAAEV
ncbi:MAG: MFS transporter [Planctomycetota bacterium]